MISSRKDSSPKRPRPLNDPLRYAICPVIKDPTRWRHRARSIPRLHPQPGWQRARAGVPGKLQQPAANRPAGELALRHQKTYARAAPASGAALVVTSECCRAVEKVTAALLLPDGLNRRLEAPCSLSGNASHGPTPSCYDLLRDEPPPNPPRHRHARPPLPGLFRSSHDRRPGDIAENKAASR